MSEDGKCSTAYLFMRRINHEKGRVMHHSDYYLLISKNSIGSDGEPNIHIYGEDDKPLRSYGQVYTPLFGPTLRIAETSDYGVQRFGEQNFLIRHEDTNHNRHLNSRNQDLEFCIDEPIPCRATVSRMYAQHAVANSDCIDSMRSFSWF